MITVVLQVSTDVPTRACPYDHGLFISEVVPAARSMEMLVQAITIAVDAAVATPDQLEATEKLLAEHSGVRARVVFSVHTEGVALTMVPDDRWRVHPSTVLVDGLRRIWGQDAVHHELVSAERLMAG